MQLSNKPVKPAPLNAYFRFARHLADDVDPVTRKHCITISINNHKRLIPVDEPVKISKEEFELLAIIGNYLPVNREYDPLTKT